MKLCGLQNLEQNQSTELQEDSKLENRMLLIPCNQIEVEVIRSLIFLQEINVVHGWYKLKIFADLCNYFIALWYFTTFIYDFPLLWE